MQQPLLQQKSSASRQAGLQQASNKQQLTKMKNTMNKPLKNANFELGVAYAIKFSNFLKIV